ncbi:MAG TPA: methyltransferase [Pyrinomonadaceae bacterium]|nr:methyltransferase [Pyrinomonadaceae bacterium]
MSRQATLAEIEEETAAADLAAADLTAAETEGTAAAEMFFQMATGHWVAKAIYVAARLGVADLLTDGPKTADELAAATAAHAPTLRRLMRALAGVGVFTEDEGGRYGASPLTQFMRRGAGSMRGMVLHLGETASWLAWDELLGSVRTGEQGFKRAHGVEVFPYYAAHPESNEPFNEAMVELSGVVAAAVVEAYDFSRFGKIVDVGGGHGGLLTAILRANPDARGVVFDQPEIVAGARELIGREGLTERCETEGGDFFEGVTGGGDAYVMKWIIHDWDDERALTILRNVRRAIPPQGRLLLCEQVVPEGGGPSPAKMMDLQMLVMTGGRERTETEYRELLKKAGFELTRVVETKSLVSIVEAVPAGD